MVIKENGRYKAINVYGLIDYFDTYDEAINFIKESRENCYSDY